jgi:hypothetical protein
MSGLGAKLHLAARYVEAGDFTTITGYRHVVRVEPVVTTHGRGRKKRSYVSDVKLHRVMGDHDVVPAEQTITVYRRSAAA